MGALHSVLVAVNKLETPDFFEGRKALTEYRKLAEEIRELRCQNAKMRKVLEEQEG